MKQNDRPLQAALETGRMMRVRIDDANEANNSFEVLMGDQVEPRREFIDENALSVANLDI